MRIFHWLLLLFFAVPLAEIYVLLEVGGWIGALPTIGLVVFTAMLGAVLVRAQGFSTLMRVQECLNRGELPAIPLLEGACLLVAGALLLTPGFVTDTMGFVLLVPPLRRYLIEMYLARHVQLHVTGRGFATGHTGAAGGAGDVIEGEFRREDRPPPDSLP